MKIVSSSKIVIKREMPFLNIEGYRLIGVLSQSSPFPPVIVVNLAGLHTPTGGKIKSVFQYDSLRGIDWHSGKETIGLSEAERLCFEVVPHGYSSIMNQNLILKNPFWQEFLDEIKNCCATLEVLDS